MKPSKVLIYALILVLAGAALWWSLGHEEKTKESREIADKVLSLDNPLKAQYIQLSGSWYTQPISIERLAQEHRWQIKTPVDYPAEAVAVSTLLNTVIDARLKKRIKGPFKLEDFGLKPPMARVAITDREGKKHELWVGNPTPDNQHIYAATPQAEEIWLLDARMRSQLATTLLNYRDKSVLNFVALDVSRVEMENWPQGLAVERNKGGKEPTWEMPGGVRASADAVEDLIYQIHGLQTIEFLDQGIDLAKMGLVRPRARVILTLTSGNKTGFVIGGPTGGEGESYVRRIIGGPVMVVKDANLKMIQRKPFALTERGIFRFQRNEAVALSVSRGKKELKFRKEEGRWHQVQARLPDPRAWENLGLFIWELKNLKWEKILGKKALSGLENPQGVIKVTLAKPSSAPKKPAPVQAISLSLWGVDKSSGLMKVTVRGRPEVFGVSAEAFKDMPAWPKNQKSSATN